MATKKKKSKSMDRKLVARMQPHELASIAKTYKIPIKAVRAAAKEAGRSRAKVYAELREMGYNVNTRYTTH